MEAQEMSLKCVHVTHLSVVKAKFVQGCVASSSVKCSVWLIGVHLWELKNKKIPIALQPLRIRPVLTGTFLVT